MIAGVSFSASNFCMKEHGDPGLIDRRGAIIHWAQVKDAKRMSE
jgi:hypothetical protein